MIDTFLRTIGMTIGTFLIPMARPADPVKHVSTRRRLTIEFGPSLELISALLKQKNFYLHGLKLSGVLIPSVVLHGVASVLNFLLDFISICWGTFLRLANPVSGKWHRLYLALLLHNYLWLFPSNGVCAAAAAAALKKVPFQNVWKLNGNDHLQMGERNTKISNLD